MQETEVNKIYEDLSRLRLEPKKIFVDGVERNLKDRKSILELKLNRPFVVVKAIGKNHKNKEVIYKREWGKTSAIEDIHKEAIMYQNILPRVNKLLPPAIRKRILFPKLLYKIKKGGEIKAIIRENIEGVICGSRYANKKNVWNTGDIKTITSVIKTFQSVDPDEIRRSGLNKIPKMDFLKLYKELFDKQTEPVKKTLGLEYIEKLWKLYEEYKKDVLKQKPVILSEEIFGYNIIKTRDGRLGFIDWERPYIGRDISSDYGKFISRLWVNPVLYEKAVDVVLEINKKNPYFRNLLRATMVSHLFNHFYKNMGGRKDKRKEALRAVKFFKKSFKEILDKKGIWAI